MNFAQYLSSRFVLSQIKSSEKKGMTAFAENEAVKFLMWLGMKVMTSLYAILIPIQYLAVILHVIPQPKSADNISLDYRRAELAKKAEAEAISKEVVDNLKGSIQAAH